MDSTLSLTDRMRDDILAGALAPGDRLVEHDLCQRYEVGRAAVRTAIVELAKEGLLLREANRGATVRRVSVAEAIQVSEARQALESLIAACAATNAGPDDRRELTGIIESMAEAVAAEDHARYSELNGLLHRRLREMSGHVIAAELVANLRARTVHQRLRLALRPGRPAQSLGQHRAIVSAVIDGDPERARQAMADHLGSVIEALREIDALGLRG